MEAFKAPVPISGEMYDQYLGRMGQAFEAHANDMMTKVVDQFWAHGRVAYLVKPVGSIELVDPWLSVDSTPDT